MTYFINLNKTFIMFKGTLLSTQTVRPNFHLYKTNSSVIQHLHTRNETTFTHMLILYFKCRANAGNFAIKLFVTR